MRFLSLSSAVAALASLAAAEELTTFSLVINRDGAIFTKVLTSTVGNTDIGYAQQYVTNTNIHVYTVGDAEASSSFWAYVNGATATESSSATSTAEATSSTEASSSEVTSAPESSEATTTSSSAAELTTETVVLYKNNHLFTKVVTNTVGIINPERAAASGNTNVLAYTVGDSSASASFYSALYEKTAAAQSSQASSSPAAVSSQASSSPAAVSSQSSAAASSSADIATYEGAAAQNVAMVGMGALLSGMAVLLIDSIGRFSLAFLFCSLTFLLFLAMKMYAAIPPTSPTTTTGTTTAGAITEALLLWLDDFDVEVAVEVELEVVEELLLLLEPLSDGTLSILPCDETSFTAGPS
ncbi:hypothetical protein OGATHE_006336 [Ogataea polymorpha]|uniref:Uncharacterized protein n=1 Tax=Ogataea polymorpha TaxID=460523 RepID=A0A9P8NU80_9ASCO|nr:hypothetical protein OGATHE_006336 [Ogataea polymorpha]